MKKLLWISKSIPNLLKSAGDIRALRLLEILRKDHEIFVIGRSADYGESDVKRIGCKSFLNGNFKGKFEEIIKDNEIDSVILSHWTVANEMLDFVRSKSNAKIYIDTVDVEFLRLQRKLEFDGSKISENEVQRVKKLELEVYKKADFLITASKIDEEELLKNGDFKCIEFPCIYNVNKNYVPNGGKSSYIICNWTHEPNIVTTKYVCEKIIPFVDTTFHIVGKHPPEEIKKYASEKILIKGPEYEIDKFLNTMNILICPIFWGAGVNGKLVEAISFGIPVITSELGALPLGLEHGKNCLIGKSEKDYIDLINLLLRDKELRNKLSTNGRKFAEKYSLSYWKNNLKF